MLSRMDALDAFKAAQRENWPHFAPLASVTTVPAAKLVRHAGICPGNRVLDIACGTGVVAVTAARLGARVTALDLTPELLAVARDNAGTAGVEIDFHEGDCEQLPFGEAAFDVVVSQFGHIFAPRPEVALGEMLRVLEKGGTIAFSTWPPELFVGRMFALVSRYVPPPPGVAPPPSWGDPAIVAERLGAAVRDIRFDRDTVLVPSLSPQHHREVTERTAGPVVKMVETLRTSDPGKLAAFRQDYEALAAEYFVDNTIRQGYLMTRATKN
jgi:SAM-dependent methyltransferase